MYVGLLLVKSYVTNVTHNLVRYIFERENLGSDVHSQIGDIIYLMILFYINYFTSKRKKDSLELKLSLSADY